MERAHEGTASAAVCARPHPIYFAGAAGWVAFVALATVLVIRHNELKPATNWTVAGWGALAAISGVVGPVLRWLRTSVELDAAGARCTTGIVWRSSLDVPLEDVREMSIDQSYVARRLGYGHLRIVDDAGMTHVLPPIGDLATWRAAISRRERRVAGRRS
jgi:uncharacterized membrane protein YdbT with pleckstrin-like domain